MSTVIATSVLPDSTANDTLTIGGTGDSVVISGDSLNSNSLQDTGGNIIYTADGAGKITAQGIPGAMTLLLSQSASSSDNISFTTQFTSTYDVYLFKFIAVRPGTNDVKFQFNLSTNGGASYNHVEKTSTYWNAFFSESATDATLAYHAASDLAQGTGYQRLTSYGIVNQADGGGSGDLYLFGPSSTIFVKQWYSTFQYMADGYTLEGFSAGYGNTTSAVDAVNFQMSSGNIATGTISLYGINKS